MLSRYWNVSFFSFRLKQLFMFLCLQQQHQDRNQMLFTAYDPSRDLSPNLPTTTCESVTNVSSSGGPSRSNSNSGCSTPMNTRIGMCCSFKDEYGSNDFPKPPSGCQDCGRHTTAAVAAASFNRRLICKSENDNSSVDYDCRTELYEYKKSEYVNQSIETKQENSIGSPEDDILKVCAGCGRHISDRFYLLALERHWHVSCLQCSQCGRTLDDEITCFARDGNIYCRKDYQR